MSTKRNYNYYKCPECGKPSPNSTRNLAIYRWWCSGCGISSLASDWLWYTSTDIMDTQAALTIAQYNPDTEITIPELDLPFTSPTAKLSEHIQALSDLLLRTQERTPLSALERAVVDAITALPAVDPTPPPAETRRYIITFTPSDDPITFYETSATSFSDAEAQTVDAFSHLTIRNIERKGDQS